MSGTAGTPLRLGTRRSALATTQSTLVADALRAHGHDVELVTIDADTTPRSFQRELRWNAAYHRLASRL